jgi:hypothetical protein
LNKRRQAVARGIRNHQRTIRNIGYQILRAADEYSDIWPFTPSSTSNDWMAVGTPADLKVPRYLCFS